MSLRDMENGLAVTKELQHRGIIPEDSKYIEDKEKQIEHLQKVELEKTKNQKHPSWKYWLLTLFLMILAGVIVAVIQKWFL